jgi:ribonuclease D
LISNARALAELIDRIAPLPRIALDTEADSLHCYFEKICLIQISTPHEHVLIDPLAGLDLQSLFDTLGRKTLILHGADYDLRLLHRLLRFRADDLFDTMLAARLCGMQELGLSALVAKYFGVTLSKASQKANWALRPLPETMIQYAVNDTRYLLDLAGILEERLAELGRLAWFRETIARMQAAAREPRARDEATVWRITGSSALSPRAQSVLRVLWQWRDSEARAWDRPSFHVIGNKDLLRIAADAAAGQPVAPPRMTGRRKKSFEVVLALALDVPESEWPRPEKARRSRPSREMLKRLDDLRAVRDRVAKELDLDASILAPKHALEAVSVDPGCDALMPWQRRLLGMDLVQPSLLPAEAVT